jgi:hypothetical protein
MNRFRALLRPTIAALLGASLLAPAPVLAGSDASRLQVAESGAEIRLAQSANCHAIGEGVAAQNGGQLMRATARSQGGRTVCVIVVLVPGREGQRPRRQEFVVPAN